MVGFLQYLKEAKSSDSSEIVEISDKSDLKLLSNDYLRILIHFLLDSDKNAIQSIRVNLNKSDSNRNGFAGYETSIVTNITSRNSRGSFARDVLAKFDDGPLFVSKSSSECEFVWFGNRNKIEDWLKKHHADSNLDEFLTSKNLTTRQSALDLFEYGKDMKDNLGGTSSNQGSANSRYSIAYFHVDDFSNNDSNVSSLDILKALFDSKFQTNDLDLSEARGRPKVFSELPKIEQRCIVDFTVKGRESSSEASKIQNADKALDMISAPKTKGTTSGYDAILSFKNKKKSLISIIENILRYSSGSADPSLEDKYAYSLMFTSMLEQLNSRGVFDMNQLKKIDHLDESLTKNVDLSTVDGIPFEDILSRKGYGKVMSELLIPFLLLSGYRSLKTVSGQTRDIIDGLDEEVKSVEYPQSSIEKLKDYDVVFVNTESKRYAISAKFGDGYNHTSLVALIRDKIKNPTKFGKDSKKVFDDCVKKNETFNKIASACKVEKTTNVGITLELGKTLLRRSLVLKLNREVDEDLARSGFVASEYDSEKDESSFSSEKKRGRKPKKVTEETIRDDLRAVSYDHALAEKLDADDDFLKTVDKFIFGFFGNAEFQQIVLKSDLSIEYFSKSSRSGSSFSSSDSAVSIVASSSVRRDNSDRSARRKERPIVGVYLNQPLRVDFRK